MQNVVYSVYKHTTPDELVYIGATVQKPKARWGVNGSNYKTNTRFYQAIQKYGWDNIKHEVVFETDNREDACIKEKELIKLFNSADERFGYNTGKGSRVPASGSIALENVYINKVQEKDKFLKKKQVAEKFGISVSTVNNYMRQGMPFYKVGKKLVRFVYEEVEKWIAEKGR